METLPPDPTLDEIRAKTEASFSTSLKQAA